MLSRAREKGLVVVRGLLAAGWIALIASLFWDPVTPQLTRPENVSSPFHLQDKAVVVQGRPLPQEPYAMGNRIFWTMLIPLLPLFFMVAGHEAWRRICPLSFFSQLPRYLRLQRKRPVLDRRSGKVSRQIALVSRDGWARRNAWYIQFGLLFAGLNARLLFVNSDRTALALFLLFVIACAMVVGALYGGKTWCNYVCPVAVVQKIYTQPRGLLESAAHLERRPVSQSMCRAPGKDGDRSICVGCTPSCPDIDLERSHWDTVDDPVRRNVHYMFFGLMLGFYYFYYFYSGNWAYYFSGAWTHERDALAALAGPGLYIGGHAIGLPKYAAAPLVTALFAAAAGLAGRAMESIYVRVRRRWGGPLPESVLRSHSLVFSAYITINTFYLFGGRPNLNLLPAPALQVVDFMIVALSTLWFWQALQRSPMRYRREGLASSLLGQLRALRLDISRFIEDRRLEDLAPDEVYVLAKTLPQFSREQKLTAYRNILEDALRRGRTNSAASLEVLREVRSELGVSDEEHRRLVGELGDGAEAALDPGQAASYENFLRVDNYRQVLELALIGHLEKGQRLAAILDRPEVRSTIARGREFYRITAAEHESALAQVTGGEGMIFDRARSLIGPLRKLASLRLGLAALAPGDSDEVALRRLLARALRKRIVTLCTREFSALLALGDSAEARWLAGNLASFLGTDLEAALAERVEPSGEVTWEQSLPPQTLMVLRGAHAEAGREPLHRHAPVSYHEVLDECLDLPGNLVALASDEDPHLQALALAALSCIDAARARDTAVALAARERHPHWFLREVLAGLLRPDGARPDEMRRPNALSVTLASPSAPARTFLFEKPQVTVGKDASNDVVIAHPSVAPFHCVLSFANGGVELRCVDGQAPTLVDGAALDAEGVTLRSGARIALRPGGPTLLVSWTSADQGYLVQSCDTVAKMAWLSGARVFENLELDALADIAQTAEVRLYSMGAWLCRAGEPSSDAFLLQAGHMDVFGGGRDERRIGSLAAGAVIGEIGVITGGPRVASVRAASATARVVTLNGERLRRLVARNPAVAAGLLVGVARYVGAVAAPESPAEVKPLETTP